MNKHHGYQGEDVSFFSMLPSANLAYLLWSPDPFLEIDFMNADFGVVYTLIPKVFGVALTASVRLV